MNNTKSQKISKIYKKSFFFNLKFLKIFVVCRKNAISLVLPIEEISLWPELPSPPCFRIQGGRGWSEHDKGQKKDGGPTEILLCNIGLACNDKIKKWFLFWKHRPSGPMLSISRFVRLSVSVSVWPCVCLFTFEVPFNGLFAPTSQSPIFLEIQNPWGKYWKEVVSDWNIFVWKWS